jgi:hypothetical protein
LHRTSRQHQDAERAFAETACAADLRDEVKRRIAPRLGGGDQGVERIAERLPVCRRLVEGLDAGDEGVEQRLVADLGRADRLDAGKAGMQHPAEGRGVDLFHALDGFRKFREHDAVERAHRAADLRHQHGAERIEGLGKRGVLALQPLGGHAEALGHVHACPTSAPMRQNWFN